MGPFKFRLAAVLRFRERLLEQKQEAMQMLHAERGRLQDEIQALDAEAARCEDGMIPFGGQVFSVTELRLSGEYAYDLRQRAHEKRALLPALEERIAAKRNELVEACREVKSLEQLRQRLQRRQRKEADLEQQKFADDTSQRNFFLRRPRKKLP